MKDEPARSRANFLIRLVQWFIGMKNADRYIWIWPKIQLVVFCVLLPVVLYGLFSQ